MTLTRPEETPATDSATEKILVAAEEVFAQKGFDGTGMKAIAERAGVSQGLLHYHFGTKDRLYAEVIRHRSGLINARRLALLEQVEFGRDDSLAAVIDSLVRPPLGPEGGDRAYARIFSGLVVGRERDQALVRECYDPMARRFVAALHRALPALGAEGAGLGYAFTLGVLISVIARDGRPERLMGAEPGALMETEALIKRVVAYSEGGLHALARAEGTP